jgi:hypothetical protein
MNGLIEALGGTGAVAKEVGRKPHTVSMWKRRGIPKDVDVRAALARLAKQKNVELPAGFLGEEAA